MPKSVPVDTSDPTPPSTPLDPRPLKTSLSPTSTASLTHTETKMQMEKMLEEAAARIQILSQEQGLRTSGARAPQLGDELVHVLAIVQSQQAALLYLRTLVVSR
jgi:hypothetical protein